MAGHLGAPVPGDRSPQFWRQPTEPSRQCVVEGVAIALGQVQQADEASIEPITPLAPTIVSFEVAEGVSGRTHISADNHRHGNP